MLATLTAYQFIALNMAARAGLRILLPAAQTRNADELLAAKARTSPRLIGTSALAMTYRHGLASPEALQSNA